MHPRTRAKIEREGLNSMFESHSVIALPPQGYLEMLGLMQGARIVLTDSGGIQEETTSLGVPCVTLRDNTERPITVEHGTNTLVGQNPARIVEVVGRNFAHRRKSRKNSRALGWPSIGADCSGITKMAGQQRRRASGGMNRKRKFAVSGFHSGPDGLWRVQRFSNED